MKVFRHDTSSPPQIAFPCAHASCTAPPCQPTEPKHFQPKHSLQGFKQRCLSQRLSSATQQVSTSASDVLLFKGLCILAWHPSKALSNMLCAGLCAGLNLIDGP